METHHPHHVTHKKKWTEYLLEFFMLFLAVFLGFIAENIREHFVERDKEKQFMSSLVRDLELDTSALWQSNKFRLRKIKALDSLLNFLTIQNSGTVPLSVYNSSLRLYGGRIFYQNSGTLDQLKNSGGLRLINNRQIVDSIEAYDQQVRRMSKRDDLEVEKYEYNRNLSEKLFDAKSIIKAIGTSANAIVESPSIIINLNYLNEYLNNLLTYKGQMLGNSMVFEASKSKALNLIRLIKKEYHLENK
ncbi:MAG TPA: hypothetical protein VMY77_05345 [Chitinophagaceae bacterium]|nr:hypothetical protein [Chitinophagaceae bacterium]